MIWAVHEYLKTTHRSTAHTSSSHITHINTQGHTSCLYTHYRQPHTPCITLTHNHSYTHKLTDTLAGCVSQTNHPIMSRCAPAIDPCLLWAGLCVLDECRGCHPAGRLLDPSQPLCYLQSQINAPQPSFFTFPHTAALHASLGTTGQFPVCSTLHTGDDYFRRFV